MEEEHFIERLQDGCYDDYVAEIDRAKEVRYYLLGTERATFTREEVTKMVEHILGRTMNHD